jgi:Fibronectin type III domain
MKKLFLLLASIAGFAGLFTALLLQTGCKPEPKPCDPPTNVEVIGISPTSATITWSAPPNTTVEISVSPQPVPAGPFTTSDSTFTITGLLPNTDYKITLRTVCPDGSFSVPVQIALKTTVIIIIDVIVQKEDILSDASSICSSTLPDETDTQPIDWDNNVSEELLVITDGGQTARVLIYKRKDTSGNFEYYSVADGRTICAFTAQNAPVSTQTTANGVRLLGTNYSVNVTPTNAIMTSGASYTMYR